MGLEGPHTYAEVLVSKEMGKGSVEGEVSGAVWGPGEMAYILSPGQCSCLRKMCLPSPLAMLPHCLSVCLSVCPEACCLTVSSPLALKENVMAQCGSLILRFPSLESCGGWGHSCGLQEAQLPAGWLART